MSSFRQLVNTPIFVTFDSVQVYFRGVIGQSLLKDTLEHIHWCDDTSSHLCERVRDSACGGGGGSGRQLVPEGGISYEWGGGRPPPSPSPKPMLDPGLPLRLLMIFCATSFLITALLVRFQPTGKEESISS